MTGDPAPRKYQKPHVPYGDQLQLLEGRGLRYDDQRTAMRALQSIGYYRFSAYTYVFRKPGGAVLPGSPRPPRSDEFVDGATFEHALALCRFDQDLRRCLLDGLQQIEIGLRVQIGYQLGKTDPFGHLNREHLDATACSERRAWGAGLANGDAYDDWRKTFDRLKGESKGEDFVKHFDMKYDGAMPIWVATECMTFGCLTYLYQLLGSRDAKKIANNLAIRDTGLVHKYLKALNVLRNHSAHNSRVWNRSTTYPPHKPPTNLTHERLHHLATANRNRLYTLAALCAHFAIQLNPATNWPRSFKTQARKFPDPLGITLQNMMGFPASWDTLPIWNYDPKVNSDSAAR